MQYCKSCGRELKDGARFCERCGRSVRQARNSENFKKQEQIEKLQKERLERKRRQAQREIIENKRKERRRQKRAKHGKVIFALLGIVVAIAVIAVISFMATSSGSDNAEWKVPVDTAEETALPTMQPTNTAAPVSAVEEGRSDALSTTTDKDDYGTFEFANGMEIPYPEVFEAGEATGTQELYLSDKYGGQAKMIVCYDEYPGGTPSDLMKEYDSEVVGKVTYSLAGSNWYGITVDNDGKISHRKYIIDHNSDSVLYYDFEYNADSDYADDYEEYIDYIDEKFDY